MDTDLTAMAGESYNRAYAVMVNVQMLSELEEIIQYKLVPERRPAIKDMWWERLKVSGPGCELERLGLCEVQTGPCHQGHVVGEA